MKRGDSLARANSHQPNRSSRSTVQQEGVTISLSSASGGAAYRYSRDCVSARVDTSKSGARASLATAAPAAEGGAGARAEVLHPDEPISHDISGVSLKKALPAHDPPATAALAVALHLAAQMPFRAWRTVSSGSSKEVKGARRTCSPSHSNSPSARPPHIPSHAP